MVSLGGFELLLRHVFDVRSVGLVVRDTVRREAPHAIVFGHTRAPCWERWGDVHLFNPGAAGDPWGGRPRTVGILRCDDLGISAQHIELGKPRRDQDHRR